ncbi:MAG: SIR2 family protein [Pseudomonadota bacterium]|nr:SIR2 family protein [Pseudomonadota bacterium]
MAIEQISKIAQSCFQGNPVIVLGSGASMPHGLPSMGDLAGYLRDHVAPSEDKEQAGWDAVVAELDAKKHLEAALEGKNLPDSLLQRIVRETWNCVNEKDAEVFFGLAKNPAAFPLGRILGALFQSTNVAVHVVTTNYDRVIEYACNSAGLLFNAGFTPGYLQTWQASGGIGFMVGGKPTRLVKIWKVHGSLDWFQTADDTVIGLPVFQLPDETHLPMIVTPGLNKYEKTHQDPFRSTISGADAALRGASAFLTIGFGFRDQHIHPKIIQRCKEKNVPIVVLARTLTDEAKSFLESSAGQNYLGIEFDNAAGSRAYTKDHPDGFDVPDRELWSAEGFMSLVT